MRRLQAGNSTICGSPRLPGERLSNRNLCGLQESETAETVGNSVKPQHYQTPKDTKKGTMSMSAIAVRCTDKSVKLDDVEERRVLTRLEILYEGGSLDGKTADFPTRDLSSVMVGLHRHNRHVFEAYKRTVCLDIRSGRTIFRYAGLISKSNNSSSWRRLLAMSRICKPNAIVI